MSLFDKQEVQDLCEHTALCARKWSGFICKRASRHYRARSAEARRSSVVRTLTCDVIHSFDWKSAENTMVVFKMHESIVYLARDIPAFVMYCVNWSILLIPTYSLQTL